MRHEHLGGGDFKGEGKVIHSCSNLLRNGYFFTKICQWMQFNLLNTHTKFPVCIYKTPSFAVKRRKINGHLKKIEVLHFHFISIVSYESIMPIGHVISQKMAIEITRQVQIVLTSCLHFDECRGVGSDELNFLHLTSTHNSTISISLESNH
jgi:hypothetical protein